MRGLLVGRVAHHQRVPALLRVEHRGPQLAARLEPAAANASVGHAPLDVADALDPERVGEALRGVDGHDEHLAVHPGRGRDARPTPPPTSCRRRPTRRRRRSPSSPSSDSIDARPAALTGPSSPRGRWPPSRSRAGPATARTGTAGRASAGPPRRAAARAGSTRLRRIATARSAAAITASTPGPTAPASSAQPVGSRRRANIASSRAGEELRQHPVHDHRAERHVELARGRGRRGRSSPRSASPRAWSPRSAR